MDLRNVTFEVRDGAAWIKLNRPKAFNALNGATFGELATVFEEIESDGGVRSVVITGAGEKAFAAGADIEEIAGLGLKEAQGYAKRAHGLFLMIERLGKPTIAAINGLAMGGGVELALACTLRIMADTARLGLPELGLGGIPGFGGTQRLPRIIGKSRAAWYILTGETIDAAKALDMGLVHKVVPAAGLEEECARLTGVLSQKSPMSMRLALQAINAATEIDLYEGLVLETALMTVSAASEDKKEGFRAFFEKRPPKFSGD